jgi:L-fuconolactonase
MNLNRRQFVRQTARAALAAGSWGALSAPGKSQEAKPSGKRLDLSILDTHQHLWDLSRLRPPWLSGAGKLNKSHVTKDYLEAIRGLNVAQAVYMEVDVDLAQQLAEAEYVLELCQRKDNPTCAAVISGRPAAEGFREYITRFKGSPYIKGIRHIPRAEEIQQGLWAKKEFIQGIRLLGDSGMSFDLCMPPAELPGAAKLVDACPGTRFILDHCGNADPKAFRRKQGAGKKPEPPRHAAGQWWRDIATLAQRKQVVCKISGIVASAPEDWTPDDLAPIINRCIDVFGPDRVMFASDWPVCTRVATLRQWVEALLTVIGGRPEALQRKLLHDNALQFYGLAQKAWVR